MDANYTLIEAGTLWHVTNYFRGQIVTPGSKYTFDNTHRQPAGIVGVQYTHKGMVEYRDENGAHPVPPGSAFVMVLPDTTGYGLPAEPRENYVCDWINFSGAGVAEHFRVLRREQAVFPMDRAMLQALWSLMEMSAPDAAVDNTIVAHAIHDFIIGLFSSVRRRKQQTLAPVDAAVEELLRHPMYPWSLKELADKYGCSREHLTRVFTRRIGTSPGAWLKRSRVHKALELLRQTDLTVKNIAAESGFASTHTLTRHLRRVTGSSPRSLRQHR
jgi:AraC-like DNA-binding protein